MERLLLIAGMLLVTLLGFAQNATTQPKIMVIPYTIEGQDIRELIESDPNIRVVISKIKEAFDNRGYTTVDFETKLKAQQTNNAMAGDAQKDIKAMIIQGSGADIYIEVEYQVEKSGGTSVKTLMKACDISTGAALASKDAFSGKFYTEDIGRLAGVAVEKVADDFLNVIQTKFDDIVVNGRSITVDFTVDGSSAITLQQEVNGEELADLLTDWVADNAYQNNYHIQGVTEFEMIFDDVRIPLKDKEGRNYNIQQFNRELRQYLRSLNLKVAHSTKNNTLTITFK